MSNEQNVKIGKAKGRPMLTWVGKKPLTQVRAYPAQKVESFSIEQQAPLAEVDWSDWPDKFERGGLLFHGDNKDVLAYLLANGFRGKVKLIYIDPPFDSGADYVRKVQLRGASGAQKLDGEEYGLGEQIQYTDIWAKDNYLQFMFERLLLLRELLSEDGSIWIHCDWRKSHLIRLVAEEVLGADALLNEIVWQRTASRNDSSSFGHVHDTLFYFAKNRASRVWNPQYADYDQEYLQRYYSMDDGDGRRYTADNLTASGLRNGSSGMPWRGFNPGAYGNHWKYSLDTLERLDKEGKIYWPKGGKGFPRLKRYVEDLKGKPINTIWNDVFVVNSQAAERTGYPTQKPEELLRRVVLSSTNSGDLVLDAFAGSGSTVAIAQGLARRWIACDINKGAIQTTAKRLQLVMREQAEHQTTNKQKPLLEDEDGQPKSCQLSFTTWRVNDYDLQIQHNEAVELACEFIGITRNRTDGFFDGTRGKRLVKIIPFNHPLTPLDLESIKDELDRRPEEERDVEVVCLGMELAARAWLENHNRNRPLNKFHLIELRTDAKYGGFIKHEPLTAAVTIRREGDNVTVEVADVLSPTIVKRLNLEQGLFRAQIDDWRAVVDCIMIDTAYDGEVFNVVLSDVPEKKSDLVQGRYELPAPPVGSTVAVKIIDMLGEEVVVTQLV